MNVASTSKSYQGNLEHSSAVGSHGRRAVFRCVRSVSDPASFEELASGACHAVGLVSCSGLGSAFHEISSGHFLSEPLVCHFRLMWLAVILRQRNHRTESFMSGFHGGAVPFPLPDPFAVLCAIVILATFHRMRLPSDFSELIESSFKGMSLPLGRTCCWRFHGESWVRQMKRHGRGIWCLTHCSWAGCFTVRTWCSRTDAVEPAGVCCP